MPCDGGKSGYGGYGGGVGTLGAAVPLALMCWNLIVFPPASLSTHLLLKNANCHALVTFSNPCEVKVMPLIARMAREMLPSFLGSPKRPTLVKARAQRSSSEPHGMGKQSTIEALMRDERVRRVSKDGLARPYCHRPFYTGPSCSLPSPEELKFFWPLGAFEIGI